MSCRSGKVEYATREAALDAQHRLVFDNHVRGRDARSVGLSVYPCDECSAWHFGHLPQMPLVYHYDVIAAWDDILTHDALVPAKPRRVPKDLRRQLTGPLLDFYLSVEEREPMTWFSWKAEWDFATVGNPADWLATDEPLAVDTFRSVDIWFRGEWVALEEIDPDEFEKWLSETH
jgi:hypothetical protein